MRGFPDIARAAVSGLADLLALALFVACVVAWSYGLSL